MIYNKISLKILLILAIMSAATTGFAQQAETNTTVPLFTPSTENILNFFLVIIAIILLGVIASLAQTLIAATHLFLEKKDKKAIPSKTLLSILLFVFSSSPFANISAQIVTESSKSPAFYSLISFSTILLMLTILLELVVAMVLDAKIRVFLRKNATITALQSAETATPSLLDSFLAWWNKTNNFVPIEQEADLDTGHSYDGIRELDNVAPPWFTAGFAISIAVAFIYIWYYHVSSYGNLQLQEYAQEMEVAQQERSEFLKSQANSVDENTVKMLTGADLTAGKSMFVAQCAACHKADGGGGVGPNLTDDYWLHGGSVQDVFKTIKYGWVEKGMKSWKDDFSPNQIAQIASFVKSLKPRHSLH